MSSELFWSILFIDAPDVMHNSEKSIPFVRFINFSFKYIFKSASKLEPISFDAL